jgi:hypothetical protein
MIVNINNNVDCKVKLEYKGDELIITIDKKENSIDKLIENVDIEMAEKFKNGTGKFAQAIDSKRTRGY